MKLSMLCLSPPPKTHGRTAECKAAKCNKSEVTDEKGIETKHLVYARGRIIFCVAEVSLIEGSVFFYIRALLHLHLVRNVRCHYYAHEAQRRILLLQRLQCKDRTQGTHSAQT
mmetsp:Transcript_56614/g.84194  ORF Transcript_56614/g.84194 Transcript_56614/m.84194 type:complete len:113 (+) Transcript_56614:240-578(+)